VSPRVRAALALAGVFVLGAATGVGGARFFVARHMAHALDAPLPAVRHRVVMNALDRQLDLSKDQHEKIAGILEKHEPEITEISRSVEPKLAPIFASIEDEIRAELTPDQRPKFDELAKKFHEHREARPAPPPT
jgi:hypothetical protein